VAGGLILGVLSCAAFWSALGTAALLLLLLTIPVVLFGLLAYRVEGFAVEGTVVALRRGVWNRTQEFLPLGAIQSVEWIQGPWAKIRHVAHVRFVVGGGATSVASYLPEARARELARQVSDMAVAEEPRF
jgi:membrane protein YdbS with pleckstrin-like domain